MCFKEFLISFLQLICPDHFFWTQKFQCRLPACFQAVKRRHYYHIHVYFDHIDCSSTHDRPRYYSLHFRIHTDRMGDTCGDDRYLFLSAVCLYLLFSALILLFFFRLHKHVSLFSFTVIVFGVQSVPLLVATK